MTRFSDVIPSRGDTPYLSAEQKDALVEGETIFDIHSVRNEVSTFGPRWVLRIKDMAEQAYLLTLPAHPVRDEQMQRLQSAVFPVGPCILTRVQTKAGRTTYALADASEEAS